MWRMVDCGGSWTRGMADCKRWWTVNGGGLKRTVDCGLQAAGPWRVVDRG